MLQVKFSLLGTLGIFISSLLYGVAPASANPLAPIEQKLQNKDTHKAFPLRTSLWPKGQNGTFLVPVCWEMAAMNDSYSESRQTVRQAVQEQWESNSNIRFSGWTSCANNSSGIRIFVADVGPHVLGLGKSIDGIKNGMVLNFTYRNWSQSCQQTIQTCNYTIAVHEFGHALGFAHEQNRIDTPGECKNLQQGRNGDDDILTPWDINSVMNYCNPTWNNGGQLSDLDKYALGRLYGDTPLNEGERFRLFSAAFKANTPRYCDHLTVGDVQTFTVYQCGYVPKNRGDRKRLYDNAVKYTWPRPCDHLSDPDAKYYKLCRYRPTS